jgi:hypothetical protein
VQATQLDLSLYKLEGLNIRIKSLGDLSDEDTPGPISNPVVKLVSADGTWRATSWESRSLPRGFFYLTGRRVGGKNFGLLILDFGLEEGVGNSWKKEGRVPGQRGDGLV